LRTTINTGAAIMAINSPIGRSCGGATVRAAVSAMRRMLAPMTADAATSTRWRGPTKIRAMCGAARAKNEIVPTVPSKYEENEDHKIILLRKYDLNLK
jgi:hypothetical protein